MYSQLPTLEVIEFVLLQLQLQGLKITIVAFIYLFVCLKVPYLAPPKHDPVVIKLGEDSESEDSGVSDSEVGQKTGSKDKGSSGGLFGGLEMMIKEARKSAEVIENYYLIQPLLEKKVI